MPPAERAVCRGVEEGPDLIDILWFSAMSASMRTCAFSSRCLDCWSRFLCRNRLARLLLKLRASATRSRVVPSPALLDMPPGVVVGLAVVGVELRTMELLRGAVPVLAVVAAELEARCLSLPANHTAHFRERERERVETRYGFTYPLFLHYSRDELFSARPARLTPDLAVRLRSLHIGFGLPRGRTGEGCGWRGVGGDAFVPIMLVRRKRGGGQKPSTDKCRHHHQATFQSQSVCRHKAQNKTNKQTNKHPPNSNNKGKTTTPH